MRMWALWALLASPAGAELPLVVIDPGHGGELDGAVGVCGAREDEVTLSIAREMAAVLGASGQARVLLTRQADLNVPLEERSAIANAAGAALFISVHANASTRAESRGLETYFLSQRAADRRAALVAARENEGAVTASAAPQGVLDAILSGLTLSAAHAESQRLALRLQRSMYDRIEERGRGVMQAPFIVLQGTRMAAALVEVGFLTHAEECAALASVDGQRRIAHALAAAVLAHLLDEKHLYAQR